MAASWHADSLVGAVVRRKAGVHWYAGRVVGITPSNGGGDRICRVTYEDGEEADVPESEVRVWVSATADVSNPGATGQGFVSDSAHVFAFPSGPTPPGFLMPSLASSNAWFCSIRSLPWSAQFAVGFCFVVMVVGTVAHGCMFWHRFWKASGQELAIQDDSFKAVDVSSFLHDAEVANIDRVQHSSDFTVPEWPDDLGITKFTPETSEAGASEVYTVSVSHAEYLDMFSSTAQELKDGMANAPRRTGESAAVAAFSLECQRAALSSPPTSLVGIQAAMVVNNEVMQETDMPFFQPPQEGFGSIQDALFAGGVVWDVDLLNGLSLLTLVCVSFFTALFVLQRAAIDGKNAYFAEAFDAEFAVKAAADAPGCAVPVTKAGNCDTVASSKLANSFLGAPSPSSLQLGRQLFSPPSPSPSLPHGCHTPEAVVSGSPSVCPAVPTPAVVAAGCCMLPAPLCGGPSVAAPQVVVGAHYVATLADVEPGGIPSVVRIVGTGQNPNMAVVLPCRHTQKNTFRQANVSEAREIRAVDLRIGPFLLFCGRAPAFVLEHMQRTAPRQALSLQLHTRPEADWEAVAKRSTLVVPGVRFKHCSELRQLKAMGFKDERALRELLVKNKGSVRLVIENMCNRASTEKHVSLSDVMVHRRPLSVGGA